MLLHTNTNNKALNLIALCITATVYISSTRSNLRAALNDRVACEKLNPNIA